MSEALEQRTVSAKTSSRCPEFDPLRILAIGAHPDDVELGAAGLIGRLRGLGHKVVLLILTDEPNCFDSRRTESLQAAQTLLISSDNVHFAGLQDGFVRADRQSVASIRSIIDRAGFQPELIITHSEADSHNDHVEASRIARAAFRKCSFLQFSIHISAEPEKFRPALFSYLDDDLHALKKSAIAKHESQRSRITKISVDDYAEELGRRAELGRAEAFELFAQQGAPDVSRLINQLNDSPFHRFWETITHGATNHDISLYYSAAMHSDSPGQTPADAENRGRDVLRRAFDSAHAGAFRLRESGSDSVPGLAGPPSGSTPLLVGGPVSNLLAREAYNRVPYLRWCIEYDRPRAGQAFIRDRLTGTRVDQAEDELLLHISVHKNPWQGGNIVSVAGTEAAGTEAGLRFLADTTANRPLFELVKTGHDCELLLTCSRLQPPDVDVAIRVLASNGGDRP